MAPFIIFFVWMYVCMFVCVCRVCEWANMELISSHGKPNLLILLDSTRTENIFHHVTQVSERKQNGSATFFYGEKYRYLRQVD